MHGKKYNKIQFFDTVFLVTFVVNATWLNIILPIIITSLKKLNKL